jgi:serine/threonine-protein kinase HipA
MKRSGGKTLAVNWADGTPIGLLYHTGPIYFTYDAAWLATGHDLSPLSLPRDGRPQNILAEGCHGLPGFIADALPDSWGTRVAEVFFAKKGWGAVTPMKMLAWVGDRAPGALSFKPMFTADAPYNWLGEITAERLAAEAREILRGQPGEIAAIAQAGGTAGGAHPKALVVEHPDGSLSLTRRPAADDRPSLLKLGLREQPTSLRVEYAYHMMAIAAGIEMTAAQLLGGGDHPHLLLRRFDFAAGRRLHLHSLSGLWHKPKAGLDYIDLFRAAARLGLSQASIVQIARRLLFNLLAANADDHGKNHAFLYDRETRQWQLSPAFDLTYAPAALSRGLTIAGEVRPDAPALRAFLATVALSSAQVSTLADEVLAAIARWPEFARTAGVSKTQSAEISATHRQLAERIGPLTAT